MAAGGLHRPANPLVATSPQPGGSSGPLTSPAAVAVATATGTAWLVAVLAQATDRAELLHHHSLIEHGPPVWIALPIFVVAWQVMIAAMMLPGSLPAIRAFEARSTARGLPAFLGVYALIWTTFGIAAFIGDMALHQVAHATPWLAARPWLIEFGLLAVAGAYQLTTFKRRALAACRHPAAEEPGSMTDDRGSVGSGLRHGLDCLASSWALMLLMFGAGVANLGWMAVLTAGMTYEVIGRHGTRASAALGFVLLGLAGWVLVTAWLPGFGQT